MAEDEQVDEATPPPSGTFSVEDKVWMADPMGLPDHALTLHQSFREKVTHEDGLINSRTTWLLVSQTILLSAFYVMTTELSGYDGYRYIAGIFIGFGVLSAIATFFSIKAAMLAISETRQQWEIVAGKLGENAAALPAIVGGGMSVRPRSFGKISAFTLVGLLAGFWILNGAVLYHFGIPDGGEMTRESPDMRECALGHEGAGNSE